MPGGSSKAGSIPLGSGVTHDEATAFVAPRPARAALRSFPDGEVQLTTREAALTDQDDTLAGLSRFGRRS